MSAALAALGDLLPNWAPGVSLEQAGISAIDETLHHQINVSGRAQLVVQAILFAIISIIYTSLMFVRLYRHLNGGERIWFFRRLSRQDNAGVYIVPHAGWLWSIPFTMFNIGSFFSLFFLG